MERNMQENPDLEEAIVTSEPVAPASEPKLRRKHRSLSRVLRDFSMQNHDEFTVEALRTALGDRSFAALLVVFSAINLIPILPPGSTLVFGIPPLIVAIQMIWGAEKIWLPRAILNRSLSAERFRGLMRWLTPRLRKLETWIKPRLWPFPRKIGERIVGVLAMVLAILVILPIPGANWIPAFASVLMGLSLIERDGVVLTAGLGIGAGFLVFFFTVFGAVAHMAHKFFW